MNKLILGASMVVSATTLSFAQQVERPNIVIVLADDLGWGDVGFHGSEIKTPCLNALAAEGVVLDRFYTAPISTPTRAGLMTGRYPNRFGIRTTVIPPWREDGLDENEETLADMLARNGYSNRAIIGKWHLAIKRIKSLLLGDRSGENTLRLIVLSVQFSPKLWFTTLLNPDTFSILALNEDLTKRYILQFSTKMGGSHSSEPPIF